MQLDPLLVQLPAFWILLTPPCLHSPHSDPSSLFCARIFSTLRPGSSFASGPRPAVGEGEQDGEDGSVGAVRYARGGRVRRGSDGYGLGTWGVTTTVLMWRWGFRLLDTHTDTWWQQTHICSLDGLSINNQTYTHKQRCWRLGASRWSRSCWEETLEKSRRRSVILVPNRLLLLNHSEQLTTSQPQDVCACVCEQCMCVVCFWASVLCFWKNDQKTTTKRCKITTKETM